MSNAKATAKEEAEEQAFLSKQAESPESKHADEYQMSSTETAALSEEDFWRLKLAN
jgi:hypothetical protein